MSFPITHLRVADIVAQSLKLDDEQGADLLLGSLAPDGVHYRAGLHGDAMHDIGAMKKISHLCPVSEERWGQVTDNENWLAEVKQFLHKETDYLAIGYAVHVLTDLFNNMTLWHNFRTHYPDEAAKGYASVYYRELPLLDLELYQQKETRRILRLLPLAVPRDFPGRVNAEEIAAIRASIFAKKSGSYQAYVNQPPADTSGNRLITSGMMRDFVDSAVAFVLGVVGK